jgi:osmoprotectant transport system permease protein
MNQRIHCAIAVCVVLLGVTPSLVARQSQSGRPVVVASKPFGESYVLAEMFALLLEARGIPVERRHALGTTEILFNAMQTGDVDVYPEYTGTGLLAILHDTLPAETLANPRRVFAHVDRAFRTRFRMQWLPPLGFENTFAIAVRPDTSERFQLRTLSDLGRAGNALTAGFTADFIERPDGLPGLVRAYGEAIRPRLVKPLLPALKYSALAEGAVDIVDGFSTDGLLDRYGLVVLADDRRFFPPYQAAALLGPAAAGRDDVVAVLSQLSGRLDEATMRGLNRLVEVERRDARDVAAMGLRDLGLLSGAIDTRRNEADGDRLTFAAYLWSRRTAIFQLTLAHLRLVALALGAAVLVALPLGLALERARRSAGPALGALGVLQTIPSIALLAFMVPLLGIGSVPALAALWLYALYPIARATYTGVRNADPQAVEASEALGMTAMQRLVQVRLPLAAPVIMAGIRTAAVITVGAATLAAFVGAGGLGEPIVTGLSLADTRMVLSGAIPAALLALAVDGGLAIVEHRISPAHLRERN